MKSRARLAPRLLFAWALALVALPFLGMSAAAEVVGATAEAVSTAPSSNPLTAEDMARTGESYSKYLWIAAPVAVAGLWFLFSRLWASAPESARH